MKIDKHIYFTADETDRINNYRKKNNIQFSTAVCRLTDLALDNIDVIERLEILQNDLSYLISNNRYVFLLLQQLYSDLDFENITDPKKSKSVIEFMKKIKGSSFND